MKERRRKTLTHTLSIINENRQSSDMIAPGIRVARGPNWIWNDQGINNINKKKTYSSSAFIITKYNELFCLSDDGEGHIGTVCELGRAGSTYSPEKTVIVNWDSGNRSNYRVGYQDQFDLIVVDNAQIGMNSFFFQTHLSFIIQTLYINQTLIKFFSFDIFPVSYFE